MNYWKECIKEAFDDSELVASDKQIDNVTDWIEGAFENYGTATGSDCISSPVESRAEEELRKLKQENTKKEQWIRSTNPCKDCNTSGTVLDGWGRDVECMNCRGKGRL